MLVPEATTITIKEFQRSTIANEYVLACFVLHGLVCVPGYATVLSLLKNCQHHNALIKRFKNKKANWQLRSITTIKLQAPQKVIRFMSSAMRSQIGRWTQIHREVLDSANHILRFLGMCWPCYTW